MVMKAAIEEDKCQICGGLAQRSQTSSASHRKGVQFEHVDGEHTVGRQLATTIDSRFLVVSLIKEKWLLYDTLKLARH